MTVAASTSQQLRPLQFTAATIGLVIVALALPAVLLLGGPLDGWFLGAMLWIGNWLIALWLGKLARGLDDVMAVGVSGASFIARAWLVAGVLFIYALRVDETVALTAAAVFIFAFTFDLIGRTAIFSVRAKLAAAEKAASTDEAAG